MPYRIDLRDAGDDRLDRLVELGALDVECSDTGGIAALMPDGVTPAQVTQALGVGDMTVSPALARDAGSVWILSPRAIRIGRVTLVPSHLPAEPGAVRLIDATAFGTGLHPTTALCLEALDETVRSLATGGCARRGNRLRRARVGGAEAGCAGRAGHRHR